MGCLQPEIIFQFHPTLKTRLVQVTFFSGKTERTCTRFSKTGNELTFEGRSGGKVMIDLKGKTYPDMKEWVEKRLEIHYNSQCKMVKFRELPEGN